MKEYEKVLVRAFLQSGSTELKTLTCIQLEHGSQISKRLQHCQPTSIQNCFQLDLFIKSLSPGVSIELFSLTWCPENKQQIP